jgi:hypothetical protein
MIEAAITTMLLLGATPMLFIVLQHKRKKLEIEALRDDADYERGYRAGMERAAKIVRETYSVDTAHQMIRVALGKD